jgi:hypothetical protein
MAGSEDVRFPFGLNAPLGAFRLLDAVIAGYVIVASVPLALGAARGTPGCAQQLLVNLAVLGGLALVCVLSRRSRWRLLALLRLSYGPALFSELRCRLSSNSRRNSGAGTRTTIATPDCRRTLRVQPPLVRVIQHAADPVMWRTSIASLLASSPRRSWSQQPETVAQVTLPHRASKALGPMGFLTRKCRTARPSSVLGVSPGQPVPTDLITCHPCDRLTTKQQVAVLSWRAS